MAFTDYLDIGEKIDYFLFFVYIMFMRSYASPLHINRPVIHRRLHRVVDEVARLRGDVLMLHDDGRHAGKADLEELKWLLIDSQETKRFTHRIDCL